jgi:hypothetical protein
MDPKAMELETAKEILAEIFRIRIADVDEMILNRFETEGSKEDGLWPREFWLERRAQAIYFRAVSFSCLS